MSETNGSLSRISGEVKLHESRVREIRDAKSAERSGREAEIKQLIDKRFEARAMLCEYLAETNFVYDPEKHQLIRLHVREPEVLPDPVLPPPPPEPVLASLPALPDREAPAELPQPAWAEPPPEALPKKRSGRIAEWISWLAILPLGSFIGFSIGLLAGLPVKRDLVFLAVSLLFGIAILAMMKIAVYSISHFATLRSVIVKASLPRRLGIAAIALLIAAEATLGAVAIERYSRDQALTESEVLPLWICAIIALCFSTPILLSSAWKGWADAHNSITERDLALQRMDKKQQFLDGAHARSLNEFNLQSDKVRDDLDWRYEKAKQDLAAAESRRQEELNSHAEAVDAHHAKVEATLREHREAVQASIRRAEEADEVLRTDPRWQAALKLYNLIGVLTNEIKEKQEALTSSEIAQGYDLSAARRVM